MKKIVFIAGPYISNPEENVRKAIYWANVVMNEGYIPIIPHLYHFMNKEYPRTEEIWRETSLDILKRCDILFRILGESEGADKEVQLATELESQYGGANAKLV